jgi:transketolase
MYIAEQNMVGAAVGLSCRGKIPLVSTFAAFLTRAFDQIRMAQYSNVNIKFIGSHAGVSIGEDGPSQMGLEDIAMFRTLLNSVVLYPCDAVSTEKLVEVMARHVGLDYLRTTRGGTPVIYSVNEEFQIGGSKVLRKSEADQVTLVGAGVTLHEVLTAYETLRERGVAVRVIDLYSIKPLDLAVMRAAASASEAMLTVEDHFLEGGMGEAVAAALSDHPTPVHCLGVRKTPKSGKTGELLDYEGISASGIVQKVETILKHQVSQVDG